MTKIAAACSTMTRRSTRTRPSSARLKSCTLFLAKVRPGALWGRLFLETLAVLEDEGDGRLDAEPLRLFLDHRCNGVDEGLLVDGDDLLELRLELVEGAFLGNLPGAPHIGLGELSGLDDGRLLLVVEAVVEAQRHGDAVGNTGVLVERVVFADLVELLGHDRGMVVLGAVDDTGLQGRIELGPGDRRAGAAHRLDHLDGDRRGHDTHLLTLEIGRRADRFITEEIARPAID